MSSDVGAEVDWARMVNKPQWMVQFNNASRAYSQNVHITWRDALENSLTTDVN
jgi:hypothetical protein